MVRLDDKNRMEFRRQSSKGNQLKWEKEGVWYKADYTGYEGLAEFLVSNLLNYSSLEASEYVLYQTEDILYKNRRWTGCRSKNFLDEEWQIITLERLFKQQFGYSLYKSVFKIIDVEDRLAFLVDQVIRATGLNDFGVYMNKLLTLDALFLNEDRHMHNIAVLTDSSGHFAYCPFFDHGAALLSDTSMDYPMEMDILPLISSAQSKTVSWNFDEQLDASEALYGLNLKFDFDMDKVSDLIKKEDCYGPEIHRRVEQILEYQIGKYSYLFNKNLIF